MRKTNTKVNFNNLLIMKVHTWTTLERCFVLEEKLRDLTGDEIIIWQGQGDTNDLEVVEHSGGGHPNQRQAMQQPGSIRNLMTKFFRSPTAPPPQSPLITNSEHHQIVSTQWAFFIVLEFQTTLQPTTSSRSPFILYKSFSSTCK